MDLHLCLKARCFVALSISAFVLFATPSFGQDGVIVDYDGQTREPSAVLEAYSTDQGFLAPRVALTGTSDVSTISSPATALLVYNTQTISDVTPGYYYWNGSSWIRIVADNTPIDGSGAATQVAFWNGTNSLSSDADLFWDNGSKELGIGVTNPAAKLHVAGATYLFNNLGEDLRVGRNANEHLSVEVGDNHAYFDYEQDDDSNGPHHLYIRNQASGTGENSIRFQTSGSDRLIIADNGTIQLNNYTTNGLLKTTGSNGTLAIATGADLPSGSDSYIQNQYSSAQPSADYWISGRARANAFGVSNTSNSTGLGVSLYGGPAAGQPTYGLMFAGTQSANFGNHGSVAANDWATFFTMSNTTSRGWIFRRGSTNVASISGGGNLDVDGTVTWGSTGELTADQGSSIELGGSGSPYIDLKNAQADDYDIRLQLTGNDELQITGGRFSLADNDLVNVHGFQMKDWDDNTGGADDKYRLLARDGAFMFYNGGVVVGNYGNGTWSDLADGNLIVEEKIGVATTTPVAKVEVNGVALMKTLLTTDIQTTSASGTCNNCTQQVLCTSGWAMISLRVYHTSRTDYNGQANCINMDGLLGTTQTWYTRYNQSTSLGSSENGNSQDNDDAWHTARCPDNWVVTGMQVRVSNYWDNDLDVRCQPLVSGLETTSTDGAYSMINNEDRGDDKFEFAACPAGTVVKRIRFYANDRFDGNLQLYCTGIRGI